MSQKPKIYSVLLVDDDPDILELFKESLEDLSLTVYTALNGAQALDLLAKIKVDCLVTDIKMPVMDGLKLVTTLQAQNNFIPFFFITGYQDYPRENLNALKPRAIIFKPFDFEEASILIKNHLMRLT